MKSGKLVGFTSLFLTAAVFGSFGIWIRFLSKELGTYQQIVFRNVFAFIFALLFIFFRKFDLRSLKMVDKKKLISFTLIVPLAVILFVLAILETKISVVTFSFYAGTIAASWTLGVTIFKEKISNVGIASLIMSFMGLLFLGYPFSKSTLSSGFLIAFTAGVVDSLGHVLRKDIAGKVDKFFLVLLTAVGGVLVSGCMILLSRDAINFFPQLSATGWLVGGIFGFLLVAVNFLLLQGFQNFDLSLGSIVLVAELFFATVFGMIFLKEFPTQTELVGGVIILVASILPNVNELLKHRGKSVMN